MRLLHSRGDGVYVWPGEGLSRANPEFVSQAHRGGAILAKTSKD